MKEETYIDSLLAKLNAEVSYVDLLTKLKTDVESDIIPNEEKKEILGLIQNLQEKLWKYSA